MWTHISCLLQDCLCFKYSISYFNKSSLYKLIFGQNVVGVLRYVNYCLGSRSIIELLRILLAVIRTWFYQVMLNLCSSQNLQRGQKFTLGWQCYQKHHGLCPSLLLNETQRPLALEPCESTVLTGAHVGLQSPGYLEGRQKKRFQERSGSDWEGLMGVVWDFNFYPESLEGLMENFKQENHIKSVFHKGNHSVIWKTELSWPVGSNFLGKGVCGLTWNTNKIPRLHYDYDRNYIVSIDHIGENGNLYGLDFHFLETLMTEHLFTWLLTICGTSSVKLLYKSFAHFSIKLFELSLFICKSFSCNIHIGY